MKLGAFTCLYLARKFHKQSWFELRNTGDDLVFSSHSWSRASCFTVALEQQPPGWKAAGCWCSAPEAPRSHTDQKAQGGLTYQLTPDGFSTWKVLPGHNQTTRGGTKATQTIRCQVLHWDFTKPRGRAREISTDQSVPVGTCWLPAL